MPTFLLPEFIDPLFAPFHPPNFRHWWGTDELGRDVLVRLLFGTSYSLIFAIPVSFLTTTLAVILGALIGYLPKRLRIVTLGFSDVLNSLPLYPILLIALAIYPGQLLAVAIIKIILGWPHLAQLIYMESELMKGSPMILSAKSQGLSPWRIGAYFVAPQIMESVKGYFPLLLYSNIFLLSALDYFGLGFPIPTPSLAESFRQFQENPTAWWLFLLPLAVVTALLQGFRTMGNRND